MNRAHAEQQQDVPGDPGLQAERTALAWSRTAMAVVANALLAFRIGMVNHLWLITTLGVALLVAAAAVMTFGAVRRRQLSNAEGPSSPAPAMIRSTVAFALIACMTAVASVMLDD